MTHRRAPRPALSAIRAARDLAAPQTTLAAAQAAWSQAVGDHLAAAATPVAERDGTLIVECVEAVWVQELDLMQEQLLERLRADLDDRAPRALRFRLARDPD